MGLLKALLEGVKWVLVALILGMGITVGSGNAEPYLSPSDIPVGPEATFAGMIVGVVIVISVIGFLQDRVRSGQWEAAGRHAGLQPSDNGGIQLIGRGPLTNLPDLVGTVDGVPVTARTERHKVTSSEGGSTWVRYTLVEAELSGSIDEGAIVGGSRGRLKAHRGNVDIEAAVKVGSADGGLTSAETETFTVVGTSEVAVRAVTDSPAAKALRSLEKLHIVYAGHAASVVTRYAEAQNEELAGSVFEFPVDELTERVPADAATVTIETKELILNVDEFRRHVLATVAIANAFEGASARRSAFR